MGQIARDHERSLVITRDHWRASHSRHLVRGDSCSPHRLADRYLVCDSSKRTLSFADSSILRNMLINGSSSASSFSLNVSLDIVSNAGITDSHVIFVGPWRSQPGANDLNGEASSISHLPFRDLFIRAPSLSLACCN